MVKKSAKQLIEGLVTEAIVDLDQETWSAICQKAKALFSKIVGRDPEDGELSRFFWSVKDAREAIFSFKPFPRTGSEATGHIHAKPGGPMSAGLRYGERHLQIITPDKNSNAANQIAKAVGRWTVSFSLGEKPDRLPSANVSSVKIRPTVRSVKGNATGTRHWDGVEPEASISLHWPQNRTLWTHPNSFDPDGANSWSQFYQQEITAPRSTRRFSYDAAIEDAAAGKKLDVVFYTTRGKGVSSSHYQGDQAFRSKLRAAKIPHARKSKKLNLPDARPIDALGRRTHETHVWVNCLPGDPDAKRLKFDARMPDEERAKWKKAAIDTWDARYADTKAYQGPALPTAGPSWQMDWH